MQEKRREKESRARKRTCWGRKEPLVGGGERVAAVEGLQDPGDAAHLAVEVRAPVLRQRPQAQVLGRHPPVRLPFPFPSRGKRRRRKGIRKCRRLPSFAAGQEEGVICSCPAAFPGGVWGTSQEGEGTLSGGRDGRARASLTVSINQGGQPPDRCCLSLSVTVQLQPSRLAGWQDFWCPPLLPCLVPMAYGREGSGGGSLVTY